MLSSNDRVADAKPHFRSLVDRFCREERIKQTLMNFLGNARAIVCDADFDAIRFYALGADSNIAILSGL